MATKGNPSRKIVRRKQLSGAQKLKAYGKKAIMLGVTAEVWQTLKRAADAEERPLSQFIIFYARRAALARLSSEGNT